MSAVAMVLALQPKQEPGVAGFTLDGRHIGKLDRFIGQAQRAALRADRRFEGVTIAVDCQGSLRVHAAGMNSMLL